MATTAAIAHPNIALIKYWGKQDKPGNFPATPNLSITLSDLETHTRISDHEEDEIWLNDQSAPDIKIARFLAMLRNKYDIGPVKIVTDNNFPTGAGLASSASGFSALMCGLNKHFDLGMNADIMSDWARQGSASAARSMFAGFVALVPPLWRAQPIANIDHWPLHTVVAITSDEAKKVSSTEGMERSRRTSPFYKTWVHNSSDDFALGFDAVNNRDFEALAQVAELSCLKMHSVMLTSIPTLSYWNSASLDCMDVVRNLRADGVAVFFTIDAGPQVKAICLPEATDTVAEALSRVPGVKRTICCRMGEGARIIPS